ncbi:MAG: O-antigen ligase family protein [Balneolales bacterium]|nr:O-antigen ligase family protein [Balneolales bacterium]
MPDFILDTRKEAPEHKDKPAFLKWWLYKVIIREKLQNTAGLIFFSLAAVFMGVVAGKLGVVPMVLIAGAAIGIPVGLGVIFNLKFGVILLYVLLFTVLGVTRLIPGVPFGISFDAITVGLLYGLIVKQATERDWSFAWHPIGILVLIWILYNLALVANPWAQSRLAWVYTIRSIAAIMILYYILLYTIDSIAFLKLLIYLWLGLAFVGALYGIYQDIFGLMAFEWAWLTADPVRFRRYYQFGNVRVWSYFSGPMVFGVLMSLSAVATIYMAGTVKRLGLKIAFVFAAFIMLYGMIVSGTRAAYVVPIIAIVTFVIFKGDKRILVASAVGGFLFMSFINIPFSNDRIRQFQSAFKPGDDSSFEVRQMNQAFIKPFIRSHPIGGGLGSTGVWGQRFSPNSPLSQFPPDSGYVRTAVEAGWVGLLIFNSLLFLIGYEGIKNYFKIRDPDLKIMQLMLIAVLYGLMLTNYPQETIGSPPINAIFFLCAAGVTNILKIDNKLALDRQRRRDLGEEVEEEPHLIERPSLFEFLNLKNPNRP